MYSQEKTFSSLAKVLSNYDRVIIDTCALMDEGFPQFMDTLVGSKRYWKDGLQIITLKECIEELEKHASNKDWHYSDARIDAVRALNILKDAQKKHHVIQVAKRQQRKGDTFADPSILATATVLRIHYRVLVITQDKNLAYDLDRLNNLGSQNGRFLAVMRINAGGQLEGHPSNKPKDFKKPEAKKEKNIAPKSEQKEIKKIEVKPVLVPKIEQKPAKISLPKKEEKPVNEAKQNKPFYNFGPTPVDAVIASAKRLNVLIRDDASIPYVKGIHGPVDVTKDALLSKLPLNALSKTGDSLTINIKGLKAVVEKTERDFRAVTSLEAEPVKKEQTPVKATPQKVEEPKEVKQPETKQVVKPIEKKASDVSKKPAPTKKEQTVAKPEVKKAPKAEKKAEEKKPAAKKAAEKKTEIKDSAKTAEKKPAAPKKTNLEKAQALEKRLSSNVSNPNYPKEKKLKDIDSFFKLYDKLSEDEKKQIKLDTDFLKQQKESL